VNVENMKTMAETFVSLNASYRPKFTVFSSERLDFVQNGFYCSFFVLDSQERVCCSRVSEDEVFFSFSSTRREWSKKEVVLERERKIRLLKFGVT
jgi:hypothetical protein